MKGFTVVEVLIAMVVLALASAIAVPVYQSYVQRAKQTQAIVGIMEIEYAINRFVSNTFQYPDDLAAIGMDTLLDPWDQPYVYLRIDGAALKGKGKLRKDKNLNPLNTDFDLYSLGPDGDSKGALTANPSHDDIIRAGNGGFVGVADEF